MFARHLALVTALLALACADTDSIDTDLQRDPPRGSLRVVSLLPVDPVDLAVTVKDEAPVSFAGLQAGVTAWRGQVAGDATVWVLKDGSPMSSADLTLGEEARVSVLVTAGAATPQVTWLEETFTPAAGVRVRFINGLATSAVAASVAGVSIGGVLDPNTATEWVDVDDDAAVEVVVADAGVTHRYGPIALAAGTFVTLAAFPGTTGAAPPRLLVFHDTVTNAVPAPTVLEAAEAP